MLDTTRKVATPEGIELTLRLAGPVPRAMAWAVDLAIRAGIVFAVMSVALQFGRAGWGVVLLTLFFVEWLLPAWLEAAWRGQTPGKRVMRLAVLNDDGTPVRWPAALTRNLLRAVDFLPFLYGVGLVSMLASRDAWAISPRPPWWCIRPRRRRRTRTYRWRSRSRRRWRSPWKSSARCWSSPNARPRSPRSAWKSSPSCPRRSSATCTVRPRRGG